MPAAEPIAHLHESKRMPLKPVKPILVLAVAALVLVLPVLIYGPVFLGHDTREHLSFGQHFAEQFWQGDLYPRWLVNMNNGLGSASLFVYPPLPSYVYALLLPVSRIVHLHAFALGEYLCMLTSGVCAFFWMTTIASRRVSLISAAIYMLLPYHLAIDFYRRDALSECWALAWMPLVLYFTTQLIRKKRYATVGLALSYALLIVSHLVSVLILSVLPFLLALTIAERGRRAKAFLAVAGCLALGTIVSSAYLLPALANAKYFSVSMLQIPIDNSPTGNLLTYGVRLLTRHSGKSGFIQAISLATVDTALFLALCGFVAFRKAPRSCHRAQVLLWLAACPIPLFLMSGPSLGFWRALPAFASGVQFPWRLDVVLCVAALPLVAFLLTNLAALSSRSRAAVVIVVILFAVTWFSGYVQVVSVLPRDQNETATRSSIHDGWFAAWTPHGMDQDSALQAAKWPAAQFREGNGAASVSVWKPRHIEVLTDCAACGPLIIRQLYYPKWQARLASSGEPLPIGPAVPQGLIAVQVPPGRQRVSIEMPRSLAEKIGVWLSALGIVACGLIAALDRTR